MSSQADPIDEVADAKPFNHDGITLRLPTAGVKCDDDDGTVVWTEGV